MRLEAPNDSKEWPAALREKNKRLTFPLSTKNVHFKRILFSVNAQTNRSVGIASDLK